MNVKVLFSFVAAIIVASVVLLLFMKFVKVERPKRELIYDISFSSLQGKIVISSVHPSPLRKEKFRILLYKEDEKKEIVPEKGELRPGDFFIVDATGWDRFEIYYEDLLIGFGEVK